jgi:hypothetical protein
LDQIGADDASAIQFEDPGDEWCGHTWGRTMHDRVRAKHAAIVEPPPDEIPTTASRACDAPIEIEGLTVCAPPGSNVGWIIQDKVIYDRHLRFDARRILRGRHSVT